MLTHRTSSYTEKNLHTASSYAEKVLHTQKLLHTASSYAEKVLHTQKLLHTTSFCTEKFLHKASSCTEKFLHKTSFLHREAFTQSKLSSQRSFTQSELLHREAFTHSKLLHKAGFCTEKLLHTANFYKEKLLHRMRHDWKFLLPKHHWQHWCTRYILRFTTLSCKTQKNYAHIRGSLEPWCSHSSAICRDRIQNARELRTTATQIAAICSFFFFAYFSHSVKHWDLPLFHRTHSARSWGKIGGPGWGHALTHPHLTTAGIGNWKWSMSAIVQSLKLNCSQCSSLLLAKYHFFLSHALTLGCTTDCTKWRSFALHCAGCEPDARRSLDRGGTAANKSRPWRWFSSCKRDNDLFLITPGICQNFVPQGNSPNPSRRRQSVQSADLVHQYHPGESVHIQKLYEAKTPVRHLTFLQNQEHTTHSMPKCAEGNTRFFIAALRAANGSPRLTNSLINWNIFPWPRVKISCKWAEPSKRMSTEQPSWVDSSLHPTVDPCKGMGARNWKSHATVWFLPDL